MPATNSTSVYTRQYQEDTSRKSQDRFGYNGQYRPKTSFLDKYRPKTACYYSALRDLNSR